jgi:hypothetical protein
MPTNRSGRTGRVRLAARTGRAGSVARNRKVWKICPNDGAEISVYLDRRVSTGAEAHSTFRLSDRKAPSKSSPTSEWPFEGVATIDSSPGGSERSGRSVCPNFAIPNFGPSTYNKEEVRPDGASARCCSELIQGALRLAIARSIRKWTPWLSTRKSPIVERPHVERRGVWGRDRLLVKNLSRECRRTLSAALSAIDRSIRSTVSGKQRSRPIASKRPRRS